MELVIARNPDEESRLGYLMLVPLGEGIVFRTSGTWPRTNALYCHPVDRGEWPDDPDVVERAAVRSCVRRGAAIDLILDRGRENRSQIVFTQARGRDAVFWQSPRTRKKARPQARMPSARAAGVPELEIIVDAHERYAFTFGKQAVRTVSRALPCGDYGVTVAGRLVSAVERKSLADLVSSLTSGRLAYAIGDLAALPRAAVVVEDRYSAVFALDWVRPAIVTDGLAELQVRWPNVPIVFCETRKLAEEWTYRYLAAAHEWASAEQTVVERVADGTSTQTARAPAEPAASTAEVRAWARANGLPVPDRGRLRPEIWEAWNTDRQQPSHMS